MCNRSLSAKEMVERFLGIEKTYGLFDKSVNGYFFWPYMRFNVFSALQRAMMPLSESHPDFTHGKSVTGWACLRHVFVRKFRKILAYLMYNPLWAIRRRPLLFALEPRLMPIGDRGTIPIMLDFFVERLTSPYAVLEYASGKEYAELPSNYRTFRPFASWIRKVLCKYSVRKKSVSDPLHRAVEDALFCIEKEFDVSLPKKDLASLATGQMINYRIYRPVFKKYLKRLGVKCVVTSCHYHPLNMLLGEVAYEMGIRRVELMHGLVSREHIAYQLPQKSALYSPDDLLVWGEFWKAGARNYPFQNIVATGYPLFDYVRSCYPRKTSATQTRVLFISQGDVGVTLSKLAVALADALPADPFVVRYKLHPSESRSWRSLYPWLIDSKVAVVDNSNTSIYKELAEAAVTVGAFSTALIEGFAWGVKALILENCPMSDVMRPFHKFGLVSFVSSLSELCEGVKASVSHPVSNEEIESLFASGAADAIVGHLECGLDRHGKTENIRLKDYDEN
jgi:hypothetical protein